MYTGWNQIDGSWYYFEEKAGHDQGMLYRSKNTPDGYMADERGKVLIPEYSLDLTDPVENQQIIRL